MLREYSTFFTFCLLLSQIVQLTAKLWEAEKTISFLHAETSKQSTKFQAVKRAAQMESVLCKVKSEVDHRVEEAVIRRLSHEIEDQTIVDRERAEQAEFEVKNLQEKLFEQSREIEYLQSAKNRWRTRAKVP